MAYLSNFLSQMLLSYLSFAWKRDQSADSIREQRIEKVLGLIADSAHPFTCIYHQREI